MRLPFPERIPLPIAIVGATLLTGMQQLQQTSLLFSFYTFLFIVIATITFNLAGGFTRTSGAYIFFYSFLGLILGLVYKAYLGEPADSNLRSPILTIQVFTGGITGMLIAVILSRRITRKRPLLLNLLKEKDLRNATIGCFAFGMFLNLMNSIIPHQNGTVLSAITQLNRFLQMSVVLSTLYAIKKSKGKSAIGVLVILSLGVSSIFGLLIFSKEGMFGPYMAWFVAACSLRLKIRPSQIVFGGTAVYLMMHFLVPYSQYGRTQVPEAPTLEERVTVAFRLLSNLGDVRQQYMVTTDDTQEIRAMQYYDQPQGFFDRLTMIGPDDALIDYARQNGFAGIAVLGADFANWIPHFIWPNKPLLASGNAYAHKIGGVVIDEDTSTGISFTPSSQAYLLAGWAGIFIVAPLVWTMLFTIFDSLCGDVRTSPWGLLVIALFSHVAPEGMLDGAIYMMWFGVIGIVFVAVTTSYFMPIIGTLMAGPEQTGLVRFRRRSPNLGSARPLDSSRSGILPETDAPA
jgi:hypothetical protein